MRRRAMWIVALVLAGAATLAPLPGGAGEAELSAVTAHDRVIGGDLLLVDVRDPQEWLGTGVPAGAHAVTMHGPRGTAAVIEAVRRLTGDDRRRPIAVICAAGVRSRLVQYLLQRDGFVAVSNVAEGMLGARAGAGWLARGLPVVAPEGR